MPGTPFRSAGHPATLELIKALGLPDDTRSITIKLEGPDDAVIVEATSYVLDDQFTNMVEVFKKYELHVGQD